MNTFDGCCGSCLHMNTNDWWHHKGECYCTERGKYYILTERKCSYYRYDPNKDYYDLNKRWYIVSAILKKLELKDSYECIALLHNYRVNFLENNPKYDNLLARYDVIGPIIVKELMSDEQSTDMCKFLIREYLTDFLYLIREEKNEEALNKYLDMVNYLMEYYNIQNVDDKEENQKTL